MDQINFWIGIIATVAFAVTGVLAIADRGVDLFGVMVLGVITAIGGGTLRDIILDVPAFWSIAQIYIWVALGACIVAFVAESFFYSTSDLSLDALHRRSGRSFVWHSGGR